VGTNNAVLSLGATYVTGKVGAAFTIAPTFPPLQSGRIQVASSPSLNFGSNADLSIEGSVKAFPFVAPRIGTLPPASMNIAQKRGSSPFVSSPGYALTLNEGRLAFWLSSSVSNAPYISGGPDLRDSIFHHLAVSLQRGGTHGGQLYVDGQLVLTFDATSQRGSLSNIFPLYIGSTAEQFPDSSLTGYVDELSIYNRALSADEILAIREAGAAGKFKVRPFISQQPSGLGNRALHPSHRLQKS
jgi:hypothetical protein